jgi:hypothetical protein
MVCLLYFHNLDSAALCILCIFGFFGYEGYELRIPNYFGLLCFYFKVILIF